MSDKKNVNNYWKYFNKKNANNYWIYFRLKELFYTQLVYRKSYTWKLFNNKFERYFFLTGKAMQYFARIPIISDES